ncbi:MAG: ABC transporter permease [Bacteroidetes bacterium]|nr:ABC transporter permease [Bacteroidota bacterium]
MDFYTAALLQGLGYAAMGLGIFISLKIFNIPDITTDGSYTLGGVITAVGLVAGWHPLLTLLFVIAGGVGAGIATGLIHTKLKVNSLLAGILVMTALYSVNLGIMGRPNIPLMNVNSIFEMLPSSESMSMELIVFLLTVFLLVAALYYLLHTDFGIAMRATGNSERMVRAMGINTGVMMITGLALANGLTAISGFLLVQYQGFADINMGIGIVISGLASVMIGEAIAKMFNSNNILLQLVLVVAGSILFRLILAGALSSGLNPNYLKLVTASLVLVVLVLTKFKRSRS